MERDSQFNNNTYYKIFYDFVSNTPIPKQNVAQFAHLYEQNPVVFALIDFKAKKAGQIKPLIYKPKDKGAERAFLQMNGANLGDNIGLVKEKKEAKYRGIQEVHLDELTILDKELYTIKKMLTTPNAQMRWSEFIYSLSAFYDLAGWSLIWGSKISGTQEYGELYSIPTHLIEAVGGSPTNPVTEYIYMGDNRISLKAKDCVPIRSFSLNWNKSGTNLYGTSKVQVAFSEIQTYIESKGRQYTSFKTGDSAHILYPENDEQFRFGEDENMLRRFKDMIMGGLRNKDRHQAAVVNQKLGHINLSSTLDKAQTIEVQQDIRDICAAVWSLPPRLVFNDSRSATYNNMVEDKKNALYNCVFPYLNLVEQAIAEDIIRPLSSGHKMTFDYDIYPELLPNITEDMARLDKVSYLTDDEKRKYFGFEPLPDKLGEIPTKYQHIAVQNGGQNVFPAPGMQQGNGTFNRGDQNQQEEGYERRSDNRE